MHKIHDIGDVVTVYRPDYKLTYVFDFHVRDPNVIVLWIRDKGDFISWRSHIVLPLNSWTQIEMTQIKKNGIYVNEFGINGTMMERISNPHKIGNVSIYSCGFSEWLPCARGYIRNMQVFNKMIYRKYIKQAFTL